MNKKENLLTHQDIEIIYKKPFIDLVFEAQSIHRKFHSSNEIQKSTLLSIKTGACAEDCKYCAQSIRYKTNLKATKLMASKDIIEKAKAAKAAGSSRFCMGSSGTRIRNGKDFEQILTDIQAIKAMGLETCVTLGMVNKEQAKKLKEVGLDFYNHNIDTSREFYSKVITTRTYDERINTIETIKEAGINVCTGGILGMGETQKDRIAFIQQLTSFSSPPESITINRLVSISGTPMENVKPIDPIEIVRTIATVRCLIPTAVIRLSAGRESMSDVLQSLCFLAGANSIFSGEKLLTTPNAKRNIDQNLFSKLGLKEKELT